MRSPADLQRGCRKKVRRGKQKKRTPSTISKMSHKTVFHLEIEEVISKEVQLPMRRKTLSHDQASESLDSKPEITAK